jgi:uncharacterized damage-inducible protein DinB
MILITATQQLFTQLQQTLLVITHTQYTTKSKVLSGASIGQHIRHIIELYIELQKGYQCGTVNYENRKRDYLIETDKLFAQQQMHSILNNLQQPNKELLLTAAFEIDNDSVSIIKTNYYRELVYNIEHTVHHMALLRIGLNEVSTITLPENFGIAVSTIKHKMACAQ